MNTNNDIRKIIDDRLCIGCGLCSTACPENSITMRWQNNGKWNPYLDLSKCRQCGICYKACPNSPERIAEYAYNAYRKGVRFGLSNEYQYFVSYDKDDHLRLKSAAGGAAGALAGYLLKTGRVNGVIASFPMHTETGNPHFELEIAYNKEEYDKSRSSHYQLLTYDKVLKKISDAPGKYLMFGLPCMFRAMKNMPRSIQDKILYTISLSCGRNATGLFVDCLARQEGIKTNEPFTVDIRDKTGIPNANEFNNFFRLSDREIRINRFRTCFTAMWRNYFFTPEACFYCPDFFGVDADLSVKDAWGRLSSDPKGLSLLVVRNPEIVSALKELENNGGLCLEACDEDEIFTSQSVTSIFKHVEIFDRLAWKKSIRNVLEHSYSMLNVKNRWWTKNFRTFMKLYILSRLSTILYVSLGYKAVNALVFSGTAINKTIASLQGIVSGFISRIKNSFHSYANMLSRIFGFLDPLRPRIYEEGPFRVLITGGYGYRNVGDEAQAGANISRWRKLVPDCHITVFSPHPAYTQAHHNEYSVLGPRVVWFDSNRCDDYLAGNNRFKKKFSRVKIRMLFAAYMMRASAPLFFVRADEATLLYHVHRADVLHISGGGFLTGVTLSRLWENMLLIRIAHILGTPVILSGQTIGVFKDRTSRKLAKWGLRHAQLIYLRDNGESESDVKSLGISGDHVKSSFDDALFCDRISREKIHDLIRKHGLDINRPFAVVNFHYWMQSFESQAASSQRFAEICDWMMQTHGLQVIFLPMIPQDEEAQKHTMERMKEHAVLMEYDYDYRVARGIISNALFTLTMKHHPIIFSIGEAVPCISVSLDSYYHRKNKGALGNCGHEDNCLDFEGFSGNKIFDVIENVMKENGRLRMELHEWVEKARISECEVIQRFLNEKTPLKGEKID